MSYLKDQYNGFMTSFEKAGTKNMIVIVYDVLFYVVALIGLGLIAKFAYAKLVAVKLNVPNMDVLMARSPEELDMVMGDLLNVLFTLILSLIVGLVYLLAVFSFFKGLIWKKLVHGKFTRKNYLKYLLCNFTLFLPGFIVLVIVSLTIKEKGLWIFRIIIVLTIYLVTIASYWLWKKSSLKEGYKHIWKTAIVKIHYFVVPYIVIGGCFFVIIYLTGSMITSGLGALLGFVLLLLVSYWARLYIISIIEGLNE